MSEPLIHSHLTDVLPMDHPLANDSVYCKKCNVMLHASNNECMQTWIETALGNFCTKCFPVVEVLDGEYFQKVLDE